MKILLILALCLSSASAFAGVESYVTEERIYREFQAALATKQSLNLPARSAAEQKLALDAIEDAGLAPDFFVPLTDAMQLAPRERVRWLRLRAERGLIDVKIEAQLLNFTEWNRAIALELLQSEASLLTVKGKKMAQTAALALPFEAQSFRGALLPLSATVARDLFMNKPVNVAGYQGGRFVNVPRLFMFCRNDRHFPCLFAMRDKNDEPVRVNGKLWTQPSLGLSWDDRPYNKRGGHTPQGVYHVEGVMPVADDPEGFGKFRRLILDFAPASSSEAEQKKLMPSSVQEFQWWREGVVARDMGRNLLRIHGTGQRSDPKKSHYPFMPTAGCVSQREGSYDGVNYIDQRKILDTWMTASDLETKYENETAIRGIFYVINVDEVPAPMTAEDLARYGIR